MADGLFQIDLEGAHWLDPHTGLSPDRQDWLAPSIPGLQASSAARYWLGIDGKERLVLTLTASQGAAFPSAIFLDAQIENISSHVLEIERLSAPTLQLASAFERPLWTMQGAAVAWGQDFAFPLPETYQRDNFLGHLQNAEGGGIPLACCWNRKQGLALAHVAPQPVDWYLPVSSQPGEGVSMAFEKRQLTSLAPGAALRLPSVMIAAFHGDFFAPLALYREALAAQGIRPAETNAEDYAPAWCSWGYEFDVRPEEMLGVFPPLDRLGIHWLTLDDRWFDAYGDWNPRADTFPGGEAQMRAMVAEIHRKNGYAQLWWYPLCVEDGVGQWDSHTYGVSQLLRDHPDWLILNPDGSPARNNRGLAILDPSLPAVQDYLEAQTLRFIQDWGFDGHKLDNIYTVPPCYNPAHQHSRPEESVEAFGEAYRRIFETTRRLKPYSVTQICPCGTPATFSLLPYMDQAVTADPTSSAQIRQRIKFYKALLGPRAAVFADHVELSDGGLDFASELGAGGVPGTKFTWPELPEIRARLVENWDLTAEKEALFKQWFDLYAGHPLARGETLNLYDLGFDVPETHAIRLGEALYYAFYAEEFDGDVELRGLDDGKKYRIVDYVHGTGLGSVTGPRPRLSVRFQKYLLLKAEPG